MSTFLLTTVAQGNNVFSLTCDVGAFVESGKAMVGKIGSPTSTGAYAESGKAMVGKIKTPTSLGTVAVAGLAAYGKISTPAALGAFAESGKVMVGKINSPAARGTFSLDGLAAYGKIVSPTARGAFAETGYDADLIYTPLVTGSYGLTCATGVFTIEGLAAALIAVTRRRRRIAGTGPWEHKKTREEYIREAADILSGKAPQSVLSEKRTRTSDKNAAALGWQPGEVEHVTALLMALDLL